MRSYSGNSELLEELQARRLYATKYGPTPSGAQTMLRVCKHWCRMLVVKSRRYAVHQIEVVGARLPLSAPRLQYRAADTIYNGKCKRKSKHTQKRVV